MPVRLWLIEEGQATATTTTTTETETETNTEADPSLRSRMTMSSGVLGYLVGCWDVCGESGSGFCGWGELIPAFNGGVGDAGE
jgi:hypothetical protein